MQHDLPAVLTRIKAKLTKFKHSTITQDSHELCSLKGNAQVKMDGTDRHIPNSGERGDGHPMNDDKNFHSATD